MFKKNGFTLLEVILVLILIGVISVVVVSRYGTSTGRLVAQTEVVKSHIRYAQSKSINSPSNGMWGIEFISTDPPKYHLYNQGNLDNEKLLPGMNNLVVDLSKQGISEIEYDQDVISFNSWGIPYTDANATNNRLSNTANIMIKANNNQKTISITPETGYIP